MTISWLATAALLCVAAEANNYPSSPGPAHHMLYTPRVGVVPRPYPSAPGGNVRHHNGLSPAGPSYAMYGSAPGGTARNQNSLSPSYPLYGSASSSRLSGKAFVGPGAGYSSRFVGGGRPQWGYSGPPAPLYRPAGFHGHAPRDGRLYEAPRAPSHGKPTGVYVIPTPAKLYYDGVKN